MRAAWIEEFGGPEVIRIGERAAATRRSGETRVRMESATLNHRDVYLRRGEAGRISLPVVLGSDGVGEVIEADADAPHQVGERVAIYPVLSCGTCRACLAGTPHKCPSFGMIGGERDGTHAGEVVVPDRCAVSVPASLDTDAAAAMSLSGLTAWNMVVDEGRAQSGEHALVLGASGGVGVFTVLILKSLGVTVHAVTSSPSKREQLLALGADTVLDDQPAAVLRHTRTLRDGGVDIAFNCVGGASWRYALAAVRSGGRAMVCGTVRASVAEIDMRQVFYRNLSLIGCSMGTPEALGRLFALAEASGPKFRSPIADVIGLDGLPSAHRLMEAGALVGKVIVHVS